MSNKPGILRPFEGLSDDDFMDDVEYARRIDRSLQTVRRHLDAPDGIPHGRVGSKRIINVGVARNHLLGRRQGNSAA